MASKYSYNHPCTYCDLEDLKQTGFFGLLEAITRFDPSKETRFLTYLEWWLRHVFDVAVLGPVRYYYKKHHRLPTITSLDTQVDEDGTTLYDLTEDPRGLQAIHDVERRIYNEQLHNALEAILGRINEHYADVIRRIYFAGEQDENLKKLQYKAEVALRRCVDKRELQQFLDSYVAPAKGGLRPTEQTVIRRNEVEKNITLYKRQTPG